MTNMLIEFMHNKLRGGFLVLVVVGIRVETE